MDIGILTVKGPDYHPNRRLMAAALEKGVSLELIDPRRVTPNIVDGRLSLTGIETNPAPGVILPRQGSQISSSSIVILSHLQAMGFPIINNIESILASRNKFLTLQSLAAAGIKVPASKFINSIDAFLPAVESLGGYPVVCKKTIGRKGREVFLLKEKFQALEILKEHLLPAEGLLLQQFIPPGKRRDFRVLVIGGKVAAAMEMIAANGDFRSNFSLSGKSRSVHLSSKAESMAIECTQAVGLEIAGIDLMLSDENGLLAIEANYAPGFKGLEAATGIDVAAMIIEYTASFFKNKDSASGQKCASRK